LGEGKKEVARSGEKKKGKEISINNIGENRYMKNRPRKGELSGYGKTVLLRRALPKVEKGA